MTRILVLGGTGMLGLPVVQRLASDGFDVRALARDPEKARAGLGDEVEVVPGDVTDVGSLRSAMADCDAVHVSVGGPVDQVSAENIAALAPELGLMRIGYVSGSTVREENGWYPMTAQKLKAEAAIASCGVPYTIFRPTWPMEQLPRFARGGSPTLIGKLPQPYHWFAAHDLARMVSAAFRSDEAANGRFYVHGPEAITIEEALTRYCHALFPDFAGVKAMPVWLAKVVGTVTRNDMLKFAAGLMGYFEKVGEPGDPSEANEVLGAPTTTLDAWIAARKSEAAAG